MVEKISIIGSGAVGSSLAFHLLSRMNLTELVLVDIDGDLAKGTALDLEDTRGFLGFSTQVIGTGDFSRIRDSRIIVITAGVARRQGMTRQDLLKINAKVGREVSAKIKELAPSAIVIVVTNPLDIITYIITTETGFSRQKVFGMGVSLDTGRMLNLLQGQIQISVSSLEGFVYGQHSQDMIISPSRIKVKGEALDKFLDKDGQQALTVRVQGRGAEIVSCLKNRSAHFAPSLACFFLIEAIICDKNAVIPVSVLLQGEYGLNDVCMGVPCVINKFGINKIIEMDLNRQEKKDIERVKVLFQSIKAEI